MKHAYRACKGPLQAKSRACIGAPAPGLQSCPRTTIIPHPPQPCCPTEQRGLSQKVQLLPHVECCADLNHSSRVDTDTILFWLFIRMIY